MVDSISSLYPVFTVGANDDEFDDGSFSGWTAVNVGTQVPTITETNNVASVLHPGGGGSAYLWAYMRSYAMQTNDYIETGFKHNGTGASFQRIGLIMADGVTWNAGSQALFSVSYAQQFVNFSSYTNYNVDGGGSTFAQQPMPQGCGMTFLRFKYEGANHFRCYISSDGISWIDMSGQQTRTLTPTYIGFYVTPYAGGDPFLASIYYFKKGP